MALVAKLRALLSGRRPLVPRDPVEYRPIGIVRNSVRRPSAGRWEGVWSDIVLAEELTAGLDDIDGYSHVIVVFHLSQVPHERPSHVSVGHREVGVFASRHPLRPNAIGISVAQVVRRRKNVLRVRGLDALNNTPVLDLKPYLPPYDSVPGARLPDWALNPPEA